ncbi:nuclear transport factor 2 family protein [Actinokineospora sp. NBRC 105648]|uniref:nuclear transport factor 2 family protein n=1 Tax=Actinokineospora sp. NBRC 105648 TaxID=3032206 RepID=UPI002556F012|nr:nuclear transport factor 2 family protein [Actinokineospora sp. NBRC 105648]
MPNTPESNKKLVLDFCRAFYDDKDFDRAATLLRPDFHNHHPGVGRGRENTIAGFREHIANAFPGFTMEIRRTVAEADLVCTHGITRLTPDHRGAVVMDIWRIQDGLLAEHWDVGQQVPDDISPDDML